ncbi:MAG: 30S ribosomal protein S9 [bacterium]|nr:30S ribosomal protein S9 [bacterium]
MALVQYYGTGKRKTSVARVWLRPGSGKILINDRTFEDYFPTERMKAMVLQPLQLTEYLNKYDISVNVGGGGIYGQAGAVRHGISKALLQINPDLRQKLKKAGLITRDPRVKERKKYGQRGARARYQFSKR